MGTILGISTDIDKDCPFWFSRTDSKSLLRHLDSCISYSSGDLHRLLEHFGLSIEPLKKFSGEEYTLEGWMRLSLPGFEGDRQRQKLGWYEHKAQIEACYQDPSILIATLAPIIEALDRHPNVFDELSIQDGYFIDGFFRQDLADLKVMFEWAQKEGIKRVRLEVR